MNKKTIGSVLTLLGEIDSHLDLCGEDNCEDQESIIHSYEYHVGHIYKLLNVITNLLKDDKKEGV